MLNHRYHVAGSFYFRRKILCQDAMGYSKYCASIQYSKMISEDIDASSQPCSEDRIFNIYSTVSLPNLFIKLVVSIRIVSNTDGVKNMKHARHIALFT